MSDDFVAFLQKVLERGLLPKYVEYLLYRCDNRNSYIDQFKEAFTHKSSSKKYNYEISEHVGDALLKHITIEYIDLTWAAEKPSLQIRSSLSQLMYGKDELIKVALALGFEPYVDYDRSDPSIKQDIFEDVLEAFLGVAERIIDSEWGMGVGFKCLYNIMSSVWRNMNYIADEEHVTKYKSLLKTNIWDKLRWKTANMNNSHTLLNFDELASKITLNFDTRTNEFITTTPGATKNPNIVPFYVVGMFEPNGTLISFAASRNDKHADEEAARIAYQIFRNTDVLEYANSIPDGQLETITTDKLPRAYQAYVVAQTSKGLTARGAGMGVYCETCGNRQRPERLAYNPLTAQVVPYVKSHIRNINDTISINDVVHR